MPIFQLRNRVQIIRDMVARVIARSPLTGLTINSAVYAVLAAAGTEDAEIYFQMARLRDLFSIDKATGSDLDERAKEIVPAFVTRRAPLAASGVVIFSRPGTTGAISIPVGTLVAAADSQGSIRYRTTTSGTIPDAASVSGNITVVALDKGTRANVAAGQIVKFVTRVAGATGVSNAAAFTNGRDRESDVDFRARLKSFVQSLSRGTVTAIESFARNVILVDGRRVLFAKTVEPALPTGIIRLYVDDGTGFVEEYDSTYISGYDTFLPSAAGGETNLFTTEKPIRDDGGFVLEINAVVQVRGTDYELNPATGQIELSAASYPSGLIAADAVRANYRYFIGLISETQRVVDGDTADPLRFPGVKAAGVQVLVTPPQAVMQTLTGSISVLAGYDPINVAANVATAIQGYINSLDIGSDVIVAQIIEDAMGVPGMFNFRISNLSGGAAVDQVMLDNQVARIASASITLT